MLAEAQRQQAEAEAKLQQMESGQMYDGGEEEDLDDDSEESSDEEEDLSGLGLNMETL